MRKFFLLISSLLLIPISLEILIPSAWAYIDPGSGSIIIQMIIGALVGVGVALKVFWYKIKMAFQRDK